MKSEEQFLEFIDEHFTRDHEFLKLGRGDDLRRYYGRQGYLRFIRPLY